MTPYWGVLRLLRKARMASHRERGKSFQKRDYAEKELLLAEAIRNYREWLWIGFDPSEPNFYLIVGPKSSRRPAGAGRPVALHFPVKKAKKMKLARFIGSLDDDRDRPS